jgi:hypothetical protein
MCPLLGKGLSVVALASIFAGSGYGSPLSSRLLPLVPPGAEIVAGFENRPSPDAHGRLLLTTHNNRLDLEDFQSLTGVDSKRVFEEVIEVAASPTGEFLSEHMLLVAGRFDRERIFGSMQLNGARNMNFLGERVLIVDPLSRERGDMLDTRWFLILDNRTAIFGTPWLVEKAVRRNAQHAVADAVLEGRLSLLRRDVTSWNILVGSGSRQKNIKFRQAYTEWAQLQEDADVLMVAARFGSKVRVDFWIHAEGDRRPDFFAEKAGFFSEALMNGLNASARSPQEAQRRLQDFSVESNRVKGSMELSNSEFSQWCDHIFLARVGMPSTGSNGD